MAVSAPATPLARIVLLAVTAALGSALPSTATATDWSRLWWRADQQGQRLLQAGHPAEAAARFSDPRRRAFADLQAGRYAQAAQLLAPFTDARSQYNRGNALAHTGQLRAALAAYDAALALAPHDADARHNRELVARALARRPPTAGAGSPQSSQGGQSGTGQARPGQTQTARRGGPQHSTGNGQQGGRQGSLAHAAARPAPSTATDRASSARQAGADRAPLLAGRSGAAESTPPHPESEQTLSLEQWLRRIPDDPAGLLRRKFMIEHLLREQAGDSESGGGT